MLITQISLILSCHSSLSSIRSGRSSRLHPVSVRSCCKYVLAGHPTLACLCEKVHKRMSLMILFLLLQQCSACPVFLNWIVLEMLFCGVLLLDLLNIARRILVQLVSRFFSTCLLSVYVVYPCSRTDTTTAWKNCVLFYQIGLTSIWSKIYW